MEPPYHEAGRNVTPIFELASVHSVLASCRQVSQVGRGCVPADFSPRPIDNNVRYSLKVEPK